MNTCTGCARKFKDSLAFCPNCGQPASVEAASASEWVSVQPSAAPVPTLSAPPAAQPRKLRKAPLIVALAIIGALLAALVYVWPSGQESSLPEGPTPDGDPIASLSRADLPGGIMLKAAQGSPHQTKLLERFA